MSIPQFVLLTINKWFKPPAHPFNTSNEGGLTYAEWQFEKGAQTIALYRPYALADEMFVGKTVLDVGCGAAGKSLYYAALGAKRVVGLDVLERYREEALALANAKGFQSVFSYVCADAADTGFESGSFDTVIMNDAVEHVADPGAVLRECLRLLAPGGRLYLNFPPYYHPYGAHLSDAIALPWAHAFFSEKTLIGAYKRLVRDLPDGAERISLRTGERADGGERRQDGGGDRLTYINHMTIKRFRALLGELPAECLYYSEEPLRGFLRPLSRLPVLREFFVKMVVAILSPRR